MLGLEAHKRGTCTRTHVAVEQVPLRFDPSLLQYATEKVCQNNAWRNSGSRGTGFDSNGGDKHGLVAYQLVP